MSLTLLAPPALEPVSLEEAKIFLRVASTDDDDLIGALIVAAREHAESATRRALVTQTLRLNRSLSPGLRRLSLPRPPIQSVAAVVVSDRFGMPAALDEALYRTDLAAARIDVLASLRGVVEVSVDYSAGFGPPSAVPESLRQAIRLMVGAWYEDRGALPLETQTRAPSPAVRALLAPWRVPAL